MTWSLCLTSRQGRKIVQVATPSETTTADLYEQASTAFGSPVEALKWGFPPKKLISDTTTCLEKVLQNQERIQVEFGTNATKKTTAKSTTVSKSKTSRRDAGTTGKTKDPNDEEEEYMDESTTAATSSTSRRSKRAASQRATENLPAVIQAQEALLQQQKGPKTGARKRPRTNNTSNPSSSSSSPSPRKKPPPVKFSASVGEGRRLADGAAMAAPKGARKRSSSSSNNNKKQLFPQGTDLSESLLGALNDSGKMGQVLRKGMKNAVQASYETARAFSRLAAIQGKTFEMKVVGDTNSGTTIHGTSMKLHVQYKGSVDKTQEEDSVDCLPREVLETVIQGIHASTEEALRPENLALLSPRVLWSLVHLFPQHTQVSSMYQDLLPTMNWSFLRRRAQQLSEKAKENLRQEQEEAQQDKEEDGDVDRATAAVAAVEHAMEHLHEHSVKDRQTRQANAALQRLQRLQGQPAPVPQVWKLTTPTEEDVDELYECMGDDVAQADRAVWASKLVKDCQIQNWRELANVTTPDHVAHCLEVDSDKVQAWIDVAQSNSVDEIIVEICDGNVDSVEALMERARSGTPKDLANWRRIPQLLHNQLVQHSSAEKTTIPLPSVETLQEWCERAHRVLQEYDWLNWYATPVA